MPAEARKRRRAQTSPMGIQVEYNPDLALRNIKEFKAKQRKRAECIPAKLEPGQMYAFLKKDQRLYWLHGEIPLLETKGNQNLSRPKASIIIIEATHFIKNKQIFNKGKYKVIKILNNNQVYFEGFSKLS